MMQKNRSPFVTHIIRQAGIILTIALILSGSMSCSGVRSVRGTNKYTAAKSQVSDTYQDSAENQQISPKDYSKLAGIVSRRLPTLREQMQAITDTQDTMKADITSIKRDISEIRNMLAELRETTDANIPAGNRLPETGGAPRTNAAAQPVAGNASSIPVKSFKLLPDEKVRQNAATPEIKETVKKKAIAETFLESDEKIRQRKTSQPKPVVQKVQNAEENREKRDDPAVTDNPKFESGVEYFRNKNYRDAINTLTDALASETSKSRENEIHYYLGESYYQTLDYTKAINHFSKTLESKNSPRRDAAQLRIAEANVKSGNISEAKSAYQALIRDNPASNHVPKARKMLQQL